MATEMLKPGGYLRLQDAALELEELDTWEIPAIDVSGLEKLAEKSLEAEYTQKQWRGFDTVSVPTSLPLFDCYIAPCVHACPIGQDVPQYIKLVKEKKYKEALELIREKNALPSITAHICDHQCMFNCNRLHHEGAVRIRDMKLLAVQQGGADTPVKKEHTESHRDTPVAIIGAGPAGLAAAYFLARDGFPVTIFEKEHTAGGVVHTILPRFRIPREAIEQDIDYIRSLGVEFVFRSSPHITIADLKKEGYTYVLIAIGAQKGASISLSGDKKRVIASLDFLKSFNQDPDKVSLGSNVVVVGGGNTAMDSARAATRVSDVDSVTVIYRRSEAEMPADREEYENALRDGVKFHFLLNPESISEDGTLSCRLMKLGEPDASGRKRPVATDIVVDQYADTLITAIGERVDKDVLKRLGLLQRSSEEISVDPATLETGTENVFLIGDARRGPSTVVECIQEARTAAEAIIDKGRKARPEEMAASPDSIPDPKEQLSVPDTDYESLMNRKAGYRFAGDLSMDAAEYAFNEGQRCLECDSVCNICVDVCPNRANVAIPTAHDHNFRNRYQILHLDSYCNECGNCATFCPYEGKPYTDKFTLFDLLEDFEASSNNGFLIQGRQLLLRLNGQILEGTVHENGSITIETQPEAANEKELTRAREFIEYLLHSYTYLFGPVQP
jgi:putative selenate reductase